MTERRKPSAGTLARASALALILASGSVLGAAGEGDDRFDAWDRDRDGRLGLEEIPVGLRANFDRVDRNGDGFIDLDEHLAVVGGRVVSPDVRVVRDVAYADDGHPRRRLALLTPTRQTVSGPLPMVVYIHGGAWRAGDHRGGIEVIRDLVATGRFAGASIGYRLTDEVTWPGPYEDCRIALDWIRRHADDLGIDPDRIAAYGHSAGGHLATMLAVREVGGRRLSGAVDFYGPTDLLAMQGQMPTGAGLDHDDPDSPESRLLGGPLQERPKLARSASPIEHVDAGDPPMLVVHGDRDRVVPFAQSVDFVRKVEEVGGRVVFLPVRGGGHGGFRNPEISRVVRRFLEHHLHGVGSPPQGREVDASPDS